MNELTSIIIPCYNAEDYIEKTIMSVFNQSYDNIEIIIIDDGSIDDSKKIISKIDDTILCVSQKNSGVSVARNNGFLKAKGKYVLFLDADDLISENFIENRVSFLEKNRGYDACCSSIHTINENDELIDDIFFNVSKKEELLNFEKRKYSCPSGYLFRTSSLIKNRLMFNEKLSSSADQYFLYEFFNQNKIGVVQNSPLKYRILSSSMSNHLTQKLVEDQILFLSLLAYNSLIPKKNLKTVCSRMNYTIGASYFHLNMNTKAIKYLILSFLTSPKLFLTLKFR